MSNLESIFFIKGIRLSACWYFKPGDFGDFTLIFGYKSASRLIALSTIYILPDNALMLNLDLTYLKLLLLKKLSKAYLLKINWIFLKKKLCFLELLFRGKLFVACFILRTDL